jgi:hypothetical protein
MATVIVIVIVVLVLVLVLLTITITESSFPHSSKTVAVIVINEVVIIKKAVHE